MSELATPRKATWLALVTAVIMLADVPLAIVNHNLGGNSIQTALMIPFLLVGTLLARRLPRNPIGWIFLADALITSVGTVASSYSTLAYIHGHPGLPLARLAVALTQCWIALLIFLPLPVLIFPDGRIPSPMWRRTLWVYLAFAAALVIGTGVKDIHAFTDKTIRVDSSGELASLSSPDHGVLAALGAVLLIGYVVISLSWIGRHVVSYRHATLERKQQLKWLLSGTSIAVVGFGVGIVVGFSSTLAVQIVADVGYIALAAVPISFGIGILRYRLYDLDRIISRTLSYAIVTGLLLGVYIGIVTLSTRALPLSSPVGVAASTLAAAALFNPLRKRVQHVVDRRFNRRRYDAEATVAEFRSQLREAVEFDVVRRELLDAVRRAVEPSAVTIWVRPSV